MNVKISQPNFKVDQIFHCQLNQKGTVKYYKLKIINGFKCGNKLLVNLYELKIHNIK